MKQVLVAVLLSALTVACTSMNYSSLEGGDADTDNA